MMITKRRTALLTSLMAAYLALAAAPSLPDEQEAEAAATGASQESELQVHYLEIVTPKVDATCEALEAIHGGSFGDPVPELGNARTMERDGGGLLGVRAPMRADEAPVVRPYYLVEDIQAAVEAARHAGAEIAMMPMPLPGKGTFAIYVHGGIDHGLWQL